MKTCNPFYTQTGNVTQFVMAIKYLSQEGEENKTQKTKHTHTQNLLQLKLKPVSNNTIHFKSCVMPMMNFINIYYKLCYDKKRK
jgi:hypothetical protein